MNAKLIQPFYEALVHFIALSKQQVVTIAADYHLTGMQALILLIIHEDEMRTMNSFCGVLGCDASNITGIIDGLERKQLLVRSESATDRRVKVVKLLPQGLAIRDAILKRLSDQNQSYILSKLTDDEVAVFTTLIQKVTSGCPRVL